MLHNHHQITSISIHTRISHNFAVALSSYIYIALHFSCECARTTCRAILVWLHCHSHKLTFLTKNLGQSCSYFGRVTHGTCLRLDAEWSRIGSCINKSECTFLTVGVKRQIGIFAEIPSCLLANIQIRARRSVLAFVLHKARNIELECANPEITRKSRDIIR